ncbi:Phospholipase abhd3 [Tyrophagus putrescentiae]|nr:Phospholipase abhd3 [Tyrophagus putrescentiae]
MDEVWNFICDHYIEMISATVPRLVVGNPALASFLKESITSLGERYWPTLWFYNTHLMTPMNLPVRGLNPKLTFRRELLDTADGGQISLDWYVASTTVQDQNGEIVMEETVVASSQPVMLFLPGITGHSQAEYFRSLVPIAHSIGYRVAIMNYRGLDGRPLRSPRLYCAATFEDLTTSLEHIRSKHMQTTAAGNRTKLVAAGISMGGTLLSSYLAATGTESLVDAAMLISTCWDFVAGSHNLERNCLTRLANAYLTNGLVRVVQANREYLLANTPPGVTYDMDAIYHKDKIGLIRIPTLAINAADDFILPEKDIPMSQVAASSHVAMLVTARGGHIGFIDGLLPRPGSSFYLERLMKQYLSALYVLPANPRHLLSV